MTRNGCGNYAKQPHSAKFASVFYAIATNGGNQALYKAGSGKIVRRKAGKRHLLSHKRHDHKRRLGGTAIVDATSTAVLKQLLPR